MVFFRYNYCDFIEFNFANNETELKRNLTFFETENCFFWPYKPSLYFRCSCFIIENGTFYDAKILRKPELSGMSKQKSIWQSYVSLE